MQIPYLIITQNTCQKRCLDSTVRVCSSMESQAFKKAKVQSYFLDTSSGSKGKMY